jgi:hypothetical protein
MRPDRHLAMRRALALGPDHCPADLFEGSIDDVLLGLKAHANTISYARHVALEDSYPRTLELMGAKPFHDLAVRYLADHDVVAMPNARIGRWFADALSGPARDLARIEWAWLESHGSADGPAFNLSAVATLTAEEVIAARVVAHAAARLVPIADAVEFGGTTLFPPFVLLTRPANDVLTRDVTYFAADLFARLEQPVMLGDLFAIDAVASHQMVAIGALALAPEIML